MINLKEDLKPCPFCACSHIRIFSHNAGFQYYAECDDCSAIGPLLTQKQFVIDCWNRRPNPCRPIAEAPQDGLLIAIYRRNGIKVEYIHTAYFVGDWLLPFDSYRNKKDGAPMIAQFEKPTHLKAVLDAYGMWVADGLSTVDDMLEVSERAEIFDWHTTGE